MSALAALSVLALLLALSDCGGSSSAPVTIPDMTLYLAQGRCPDGSPPMNCVEAMQQRPGDPMHWRRSDGQDQIGESVVDPRGFFVTTWAYGDGPFNANRGDGGEVYVIDGDTVYITATQDGGKPGIQRFGRLWPLFNNKTIPCSEGWTTVDFETRACRVTVTYPATGYGLTQIVAASVIVDHGLIDVERSYLASGWGRLCWESVNPSPPRAGMADSCGSGAPDIGPPVSDRRRSTALIAEPEPHMSDFGWPPDGFIP
jgi:hypothetical protein